MKFTAQSDDLLDALKTAKRAVPTTSTMPILGTAEARRVGHALTLHTTDLEVHVWTRLQVDWDTDEMQGPEAAALPISRITQTLSALPGVPVEVEVDDDYGLTMRTGQGEYEMLAQDASDFPTRPDVEGATLDAEPLEEGLEKTEPFTEDDPLRPAMEGVLLELANGHPRAVATDGHRLSRIGLDVDGGAKDVIIPEKAVSLMRRVMEEEATLEIGDGHVALDAGSTTVYSRTIDETYPNHESVVPENDKSLRVDRSELLSAVERVGLYSSSTTHQIRLSITPDRLHLQGEDIERSAEAEEEVACDYDSEPMEIGFNSNYLQDVLQTAEGEEVEIRLGSPTDAATVHPDGTEDHLMLLMPVMLNEH